MDNSNTIFPSSYYQQIGRLLRFLTRPKSNGYGFCIAEDEAIIPELNERLIEKCAEKGISAELVYLKTDTDATLLQQLETPVANALIITNLYNFLKPVKGDHRFSEFNFIRESMIALDKPILFWVSERLLAKIGNYAADVYSQRRFSTIIFENLPILFEDKPYYQERFPLHVRDVEEYEKIKLKINLLERQLQEAEERALNKDRIIKDLVIPLTEAYSENDLHQQALSLLLKYNSDMPSGDSSVYQTLGSIYHSAKLYHKATEIYHEGIKHEEEAEEKDKDALVVFYHQLARIYEETGYFDQAMDFFQKDLKLTKELYESNPKSESLKNGLAISYSKLGDLYQALGNYEKSLEHFEEETRLFEELYESNPKSESLKNGLAISYSKLGDLYQALGNYEKSLEHFEEETRLFEELYESNPKSESLKNGLAISYSKLGDLYQALGNYEKSLEYFEERNRLGKELYESNPKSESLKNGLAISYYKIGITKELLNDPISALPFLEQAIKIFEELRGHTQRSLYKDYLETVQSKIDELKPKEP